MPVEGLSHYTVHTHRLADYELKLRHFREVELAYFHCWSHHVERFLPARSDRSAHGFDVREHVDEAFVEAKITYPTFDASILNEESTVAGHACENFLVGLNFADVPKSRDQHATLGGSNHLLHRLRILRRCKHDVKGHLSHFVG